LGPIEWEAVKPQNMDLEKATELQQAVHRARRAHALPLADALRAVYGCFLYHSFIIQVGFFLDCLEKKFVLERLGEVTSRAHAVA
jgi:hypothetical protein